MIDMRVGSTRKDLRAEIDACGYFPELVEDAIMLALADEELLDFVVHHEPTFNRDEIHRHVTVLALTPTRLVIGHTDDRPADSRNLRCLLHRVCGGQQDQHGCLDPCRYSARDVPGGLGGCVRDLVDGW